MTPEKYRAAILALLVLCSAAFAEWQDEAVDGFSAWWNGQQWQSLALAAALAAFGFITLAYMLGFMIENEHLKRWAKGEYMQVLASFLIILFIWQLLSEPSYSVFKFMNDAVIGSGSTVQCGSKRLTVATEGAFEIYKCKLQDKITALDRLYDGIYRENRYWERFASTCMVLFGMQVYCGGWDSSVHRQVEQYHLLGEKIVPLLISLHGQYAFAQYLSQNMLSVFLPLGILLRIFPITRGVGGLFIAIAVGFFLVFPTVFILTDPSYVRMEGIDDTAGYGDIGLNACYPGFRGTSIIVNSFFSGMGGAGGTRYSTEAAEILPQLTIEIMFYPFIALALTLIFIRAATPMLGGDIGELMRMTARLV